MFDFAAVSVVAVVSVSRTNAAVNRFFRLKPIELRLYRNDHSYR